jgi:hypothetical protein
MILKGMLSGTVLTVSIFRILTCSAAGGAPDELAAAAKNNHFVRDEILLKGKVVYRAAA